MTEILTFNGDDVERYASRLQDVARAVAAGHLGSAEQLLAPIAGEVWGGKLSADTRQSAADVLAEPTARIRRISDDRLRAQVFIRDGFRCTSCGGRAVPRSILVALHDLFPAELPYDRHYGRGKVHPVFWALAPEADHVLAHSRGGANDLENLTTLHASCNTQKSDAEVAPIPRYGGLESWDGLTSYYSALIVAGAGQVRPRYHRDWSRRLSPS